jgi:hypothetical protein
MTDGASLVIAAQIVPLSFIIRVMDCVYLGILSFLHVYKQDVDAHFHVPRVDIYLFFIFGHCDYIS